MNAAVRSVARGRCEALLLNLAAIGQTTLAAAAAWTLARDVVGHPDPFFAPVAAIVALALSYRDRVRRAAEVTGGVCLGVLCAWPFLLARPGSVAAIAGAVAAAMLVATVVSDERLVLLQAATSALLVVTVGTSPEGPAAGRVIDAMIGGVSGIAIGVVLLPSDPRRLTRRSRSALIRALTATLRDVADALTVREPAAARAATRSAAALGAFVTEYADDTGTAAQIARGALLRRAARRNPHLVDPEDPASLALLVHGIRALARTAERVIETGRPLGADALRSVRQLGDAAHLLNPEPNTTARTVALKAAGAANRALAEAADLYVITFLGQVRTVAAELLQATGEPEEEASRKVRRAVA